MAFKLSESTRREIEAQAQERAMAFAAEARDRISAQYASLIERFYEDKDESDYYHRTGNLRNSFSGYCRPNGNGYDGGIVVKPNENMHDYPTGPQRKPTGGIFRAEDLIEKFIYTEYPNLTFHGGNWHGGYGAPARFSMYDEIWAYRDMLLKEFQARCGM